MLDVPNHPQASLYPSEVVTLGVLYALKGAGKRAFYRWLVRDWNTAHVHDTVFHPMIRRFH